MSTFFYALKITCDGADHLILLGIILFNEFKKSLNKLKYFIVF